MESNSMAGRPGKGESGPVASRHRPTDAPDDGSSTADWRTNAAPDFSCASSALADGPSELPLSGPVPVGLVSTALDSGLVPRSDGAGRYRIDREIGRGGMGVVYEAFDVQLQRSVAIKTMRVAATHDGALRRFLREARIASRLHHPGIMAVHEFGTTTDGHAYMVMRLLGGETLATVLAARRGADDDLPRLLGVFLQACQAVAAAHAEGIVHRDLKPANVMVGDYGMVTVVDWGLAKDLGTPQRESPEPDDPVIWEGKPTDDVHTRWGSVFGTPGYLAPEQARGDTGAVDRRTDVFGLGGILCEILTGHRPYVAEDPRSMWRQAREGDTAAALARLDACAGPAPVVALAQRCLARDPADRPAEAGEIVVALVEYLESGQRRAERELVRFFDLSADLFCIASLTGYFRRVNDNFPRSLGYSRADLLSRQFLEFVHPDDREATVAELQRLSGGTATMQFVNRYRHADGHYLWLEWNARPVPEEGVVYADARDVTERVERDLHERCLEQDRQRLVELVDSAEDAIIGKQLDGTITSWNRAAERMFGYPASEMVGRSITALLPSDRLHEERKIRALLGDGRRVEAFDTVRVRRDGARVDVSVAISPIHDGSGAVVGASLIARDISDRKVLEQALDASRRDLADFTENANVPLHWVNAEGIIVWANKAELDFLGYSRPEYVGQSITNFHADAAAITDILARLSAGQCLAGYEARLRAKDGSIKHVSIHSSVYRENGQFRHTRCFTVDISARRQGEHQAREQARLAAFVAAACRALVQRGSREALAGRVADAVAAGLPAAGVRVWLADATGGEWRLAARGGPLGRAPAHLLPPGDRDRVARWITRPLTPGAGMATRWPEGVDLLGAVVHPVGLDGETIGIVEAVSNRPVDVAAYAAFGAVCDALSLALARPPDAPSSARPVP